MSLKWRIALALAAVAGVIGSLATFGSYLSTARQVHRSVDETLLAKVTMLSETRGRSGGMPRRPDGCPPGAALLSIAAAQVVSFDGDIVTCMDGAVILPVGDRVLALAADPGAARLGTVEVDGTKYRVLSVGRRDGEVLQIARDLDEAEQVLDQLRLRLVLTALGGIAVAGMAGWLIARRIVRPVVQLRDAAETIARTQDLHTPIPGNADGEVGSLARSITTMVSALAASREQQQRLIADASHEMRTPLTSLRTNIELLGHFDQLGAVDRTETLAAAQVDVGELTHLLTELVELATDRASSDEAVEPVDLTELATDVAVRAARRSGRAVEVVTGGGPTEEFGRSAAAGLVAGRPRMLERAIANLVDNAVKYSPAGSSIELAVGPGSVEVRDEGPGIAAADLPHVFERFYRATGARTASGSGLGLAIVAQIVERHGGRVWATNRPTGGAAVGFLLPTTSSPPPAGSSGTPA